MRSILVKTGTEEEFFRHGQELARKIDRGETLTPEFTLTFEDPADMFAVMSPARLALFRAAKAESASITLLAQRLKRDRSSVKKDVDLLSSLGLLDVEQVPLPGHGLQKLIRVAADSIYLQAVVG
jgi:predicted transcriptional regulator